MKNIEAHSKLIDLPLTEDQAALLSPLIRAAAADHKNILFIATVAPFLSVEEGQASWRLQATVLPARDGFKVMTAIQKIIDN